MKNNYIIFLLILINSFLGNAQTNLSEQFETATFPPTGWTTSTTTGSEGWTYSSAQKAALADAWTREEQDTWLISPELNLTANAILRFKAKADELVPPDHLIVKVSTSGNAPANFTTTLLTLSVGTNVSKSYREYRVDLSSFNGQKIHIGFHHKTEISFDKNYGASGYYLDDIEVRSDIAEDVALHELVAPHNGAHTTDNKVQIRIENTGGKNLAANSVRVSYTLDGGAPITETVPTSIAVGATLIYEFNNNIKLVKGNHTVAVTATSTNDSDPSNNTKSYAFSFFEDKSLSENFEGPIFLPVGWSSHFVKGAYADRFRARAGSAQIKSTSGTEANDILITPKSNIAAGYTLQFTMNAPDYVQALADTPSAITKDELHIRISETSNELANFTKTVETIDLRNHYKLGTYDETSFKKFTVDLSAYAGKQIHIAFDYRNHDGFGIGISSVEILKTSTLSTQKLNPNVIAIYPNPTTDFITIQHVDNATATLFSLNGKTLTSTSVHSQTSIKMDSYAPGIYLLQIKKGSSTLVKKIIKK